MLQKLRLLLIFLHPNNMYLFSLFSLFFHCISYTITYSKYMKYRLQRMYNHIEGRAASVSLIFHTLWFAFSIFFDTHKIMYILKL